MVWEDLVFPDWSVFVPFTYDTNEEECAVLYGIRTERCRLFIYGSERVPNRHPQPDRHFRILRSDIGYRGDKAHVVGTSHTHPSKLGHKVSFRDVALLRGTGLVGFMYHPYTKKLSYYTEQGWVANHYMEVS